MNCIVRWSPLLMIFGQVPHTDLLWSGWKGQLDTSKLFTIAIEALLCLFAQKEVRKKQWKNWWRGCSGTVWHNALYVLWWKSEGQCSSTEFLRHKGKTNSLHARRGCCFLWCPLWRGTTRWGRQSKGKCKVPTVSLFKISIFCSPWIFFINFDFYKIRERSLFHRGKDAVLVWLINGNGTLLQHRRHEILCDMLKYNLSLKQHLFPLGLIQIRQMKL